LIPAVFYVSRIGHFNDVLQGLQVCSEVVFKPGELNNKFVLWFDMRSWVAIFVYLCLGSLLVEILHYLTKFCMGFIEVFLEFIHLVVTEIKIMFP
jgi:hypothetical protein